VSFAACWDLGTFLITVCYFVLNKKRMMCHLCRLCNLFLYILLIMLTLPLICATLCCTTDACTVWRHGIFPTKPRASPIPTAAVSGRRHFRSWWSDVHGCRLLAIVRFCLPEAVSRTVCRRMSPQLQRWRFFKTASNVISFHDHFFPSCFRLLLLYIVYSSDLAVFVL